MLGVVAEPVEPRQGDVFDAYIGVTVFRRAIADVVRTYGRQWWRIGLVQLFVLLGITVALGIVALVIQNNGTNLFDWVSSSPEGVETRAASIATIALLGLAIITLPIQLAGLIATIRLTDRTLAGGTPTLFRSAAESATRFLSLLAAILASALVAALAFVLAPFLVAIGLIGLAVTGILSLVRRRRAGALSWWPVLRTWIVLVIPFGALWWVAAPAIMLPIAVVLEKSGPVRAARAAMQIADGRRWKIVGGWLIAVVFAVGVSAGFGWLGFVLWGETGAAVVGAVVQLVVVPVPVVAAVALYRRSAGGRGRVFAAPTISSGGTVRSRTTTTPIVARIASVVTATLVISIGLSAGPFANQVATAAPAAGNATYTVTSSADTTDATQISAQKASCLVGGTDCTIRAALALAEQDAVDGATQATITFVTAMDITLASGLEFLPDSASNKRETPEEEQPTEQPSEAPADETPTEEEPSEETPSEDAPAEQTPSEEAPVEETPAEDEPSEDAPAENDPTDDEPSDEVSISTASVDATLVGTTNAAAASSIVDGALIIDTGGYRVVLDGGHGNQILNAQSEKWSLVISGVTFRHGYSDSYGGGLQAWVPNTQLNNVYFDGNTALMGGGAVATSDLTVTASSFIGNRASYWGESTMGGAIYSGIAAIENSTFGENSVGDQYTTVRNRGTDVFVQDHMTVVNSSFVNSRGGSLASPNAVSTLRNSIFSTNNGEAGFACSGQFTGTKNMSADADITCPGTTSTRGGYVLALDSAGIVPVYPQSLFGNAALGSGLNCPAVDALGTTRPANGCDLGAVEVNGATSLEIMATPSATVYGTATFRATVTAASGAIAAGTVTFDIDGEQYGPITVSQSGVAEIEVTDLAGGSVIEYSASFAPTFPFDVSVAGPQQYRVEQIAIPVTLACANPASTECSASAWKFADAATIALIASVSDDREGSVSIASDAAGTDILAGPVAVDNGTAELSIPASDLPVGDSELYAIYTSTDGQHAGATTAGQPVRVLGTPTVTVAMPNANAVYGDPASVAEVTVAGAGPTPTGTVTLQGIASRLAADGTVSIDLSRLPVTGTAIPIVVQYSGDELYGTASSTATTFQNTAATTSTEITSISPQNPTFGEAVSVTVEVTADAPSALEPTGAVSIVVDGTETFGPVSYNSDATRDTTSTFTVLIPANALSAGTHSIVAEFAGYTAAVDSSSSASSITVASTPTATSLTATPSSPTYDEQVTLTATVDATSSNLTPIGTVAFTLGSITLGTAQLAPCTTGDCATASLTVSASSIGVGDRTVVATYTGGSGFASSNDDTTVAISKATPDVTLSGPTSITFGNPGTYEVSVGAGSVTPVDGTTVTVTATPTDGEAIALGTVVLTGGKGTFTVGNLLPDTYLFTADFAGNAQFAANDGTASVTISAATTDTDLDDLSATTVQYGDSLEATVTVKNTANGVAPEGDVVVSWLGIEVGRATLSAADNTATPGVRTVVVDANFGPPVISVDNFWLTATFEPAAGFEGSTLSSDNNEERRRVTVTPLEAVVSVDATAVMGQNLAANASVEITGKNPGLTPQGSISFQINKSGGGTFGPYTSTLVNGKTSLAKALPAGMLVDLAGTWTIRATYQKSDVETRYVSTNPNDVAVTQIDVNTSTAIVNVEAPAEVGYGLPLSVSVEVLGATKATGTVRLHFAEAGNGITVGDEVELIDGKAVLTGTPSALVALGSHQFAVTYSGDTALNYTVSETFGVVIGKTPTSVEVTTTSQVFQRFPGIVGAKVSYSAKVTAATGTPYGNVAFYRDDVYLGSGTVGVDRIATINYEPDAVWSGDIVAKYNASGNMADSSGTLSHYWVKAPVKVSVTGPTQVTYGTPAVYTTTVAFDAQQFTGLPADLKPFYAPSGSVTMKDLYSECTVQMFSNGTSAQESTASCVLPFDRIGDHFVDADYSGNDVYASGESGLLINVRKGTPAITFGVNASSWGGLTTVPVTWNVAGPDAGTVTVKLNDTVVCTSSALTGGCDVSLPRYGSLTSSDVFTLDYSGTAVWNSGSASKGGAIVACIPVGRTTVTPTGSATIMLSPEPTCDNGTGYYTSDEIRVFAKAADGYQVTRLSENGVDYPADEIRTGQFGFDADVDTHAKLILRDGVASPFTIAAWAEARCVPVTFTTYHAYKRISVADALPYTASDNGCSEPVTVDAAGVELTAYFKVGTKILTKYNNPSPSEHTTFYGWVDQGDARFAKSILTTVASNSNRISAHFGPVCYTGVATVEQPTAGTLTTTVPAQNCHDPQTAGGWTYGTLGTGTLVDKGEARSYFESFGGDTGRYTVYGDKFEINAAGIRVFTRPFTFPITEKPLVISANYSTCVSMGAKLVGDNSYGAFAKVKIDTASNCPVGTGSKTEPWFKIGTTVSFSTTVVEKTPLKFQQWTGVQLSDDDLTKTSNSIVLKKDTIAKAVYLDPTKCGRITFVEPSAEHLALTTSYGLGENACGAIYGNRYYDRGETGNSILVNASPKTAAAEGSEVVFAWSTEQPEFIGPGLSNTWDRTYQLSQEINGPTQIIAYACHFVSVSANVYSPSGEFVRDAGASNTQRGGGTTIGNWVGTEDADCSTGSDPRSGYGGYAWLTGSQMLPIETADPVAYKFTGWSGDVSGTGEVPDAPITLAGRGRMAQGDEFHFRVIANYDAICYKLSLPSDAERLEVLTAPNCPGLEEKGMYLGGTEVVLHALDSEDVLFRHWVSGTNAIDPDDNHWASVSMTGDKTVIAYFSAKGIDEQILSVATMVGDQAAVVSKKLVGVATATLSAYVQSLLVKATLVISLLGYAAQGLEALGVHGVVIDGMKNASDAFNLVLSLVWAPLDCMTAWSAGGKDTLFYAAQNAIGTAVVTALTVGASTASTAATSSSTLAGTSTLTQLTNRAGQIKDAVKPYASVGITAIKSTRNMAIAAADPTNNGAWESSASEAFSSGSMSVYDTCMAEKSTATVDAINKTGNEM